MFSNSTQIRHPVLFTLLMLFAGAGGARQADIPVPVEPRPAWRLPLEAEQAAEVPHATVANGIYHLLVDNQVRVSEDAGPEYFFHYAEQVLNQTGVESNSQITVNFDPVYETLVLHDVSVWRDGRRTDKLQTARISLINREEELDSLLYSGGKTLHLILDDIRVGDIIEYSFSIRGDNPIYNGIFAYSRSLNWGIPVHHLSVAVHWLKPGPLHHQIRNSELALESRDIPGGTLYRIEQRDTEPLTEDEDLPHWFNPYGVVYFSESANWRQIADWARPLMESGVESSDAIRKIAARIRNEHREPAARIAAALRYVQDEVRYFGIEIGENSHRPARAGVTLARRYGDCKDKTVLLLSILRELGVDAHAALVNTRKEREILDIIPAARLFNHVIAAVRHDGRTYWLDPTIQYQRGDLNALFQPDYGHALVLNPDAAALTPAEPQQAPLGSEVREMFDLSAGKDGPTPFNSQTRTLGMNAENVRRGLAGSGRKTLQDEYLRFYKEYYPGIESDGDVEFTDRPERNEMIVEERYVIDALWELDEDDNNYYAWFYPNSIYHYLKAPKQQQRKHPLTLNYPVNIRHVIELKLDDQNWRFDDADFSEDNAFFSFSHKARFKPAEKTLTLEYTYRTKTDHVPADSFDAYRQAVERAAEHNSYGIYSSFGAAAGTPRAEPATNYFLWIVLAWVLMLVTAIVLWRIDAKRHPPPADTLYYPVSPPKFIAMWMLTAGLYGMYWFYKNWRYVKQRDQSGIMPVARGIFLHFWYYPLYAELRGDSVKRYGKAQLPPLAVGGVLAAAFLVLYVAGNLAGYELAATLVAMLLVLPLLNYINHAGGNDSAAYTLNSRWRLRHYLLILLTGPLLIITLGGEIGLMPSDRVIAGGKLLSHDIRFLQRKGAIAPGDEIVYFYSDAFLSNREDGNGYSDRHVFSYWMENGNFNLQSAAYADIKDIQVNWAKSWDDNTIIEIIRHDDSKFILYAARTGRKDRVFVNGLMKRWKNTAPRPAPIEGDGGLERIEGIKISEPQAALAPADNQPQAGPETTGNVTPYKPLIKEPPEYPLAALQAGIEGHVILEFTITHTGSVEDIKVVEAEPEGVFENAAIEAARKFRYNPQYINDAPVDTSGVKHLLSFKLAPES